MTRMCKCGSYIFEGTRDCKAFLLDGIVFNLGIIGEVFRFDRLYLCWNC